MLTPSVAFRSPLTRLQASRNLHAITQLLVKEGKFASGETEAHCCCEDFDSCGFFATKTSGFPGEQFQAVRRSEGVERDVPFVSRYGFFQSLKRPAYADKACTALLQTDEGPVIMPFAASEPCPAPVNCDQGDQDEIGLDHRCRPLRLHDSK